MNDDASFQRRSMRRVSIAAGEILLARMPWAAWSAVRTLASWISAPLGRAVGWPPRRGDPSELGGDHGDAAAPARDHRGQRGLGHQEHAGEVDADHPVPRRLVHLEDRGRAVAVGDVERHRQRLAAAGVDLGRDGLGARLLDVGAGHAGAGRREGQRGRAPVPFAAPPTIAIFDVR
jgi:hypothetical protein